MFSILNAEISILGLLLAVIANTVIGMAWYGPVFGKMWLEQVGKKKEDLKANPQDYIFSILGAFSTAFFLSLFVYYARVHSVIASFEDEFLFGEWSDFAAGLLVPLFIWLGFVLTSAANPVIWEGRKIKLYMINMLHYLVTLVVMGVIVALAMDLS